MDWSSGVRHVAAIKVEVSSLNSSEIAKDAQCARGLAHPNVGRTVGTVESGRIGVGIGLRIGRGTGFQGGSLIAVKAQEIGINGFLRLHKRCGGGTHFF